MLDQMPIIGVMGSHAKGWEEYTVPLGRMIAQHDYHLLTGAGAGVMMAVSKAFCEKTNRAGLSIGIVPTVNYDGKFVPRAQYPNPYIEIPILTPLDIKAQNDSTPFSRNYVNVMTSHAIIALPGEHGTQNEVSLAIHFKKPLILFGPETAFDKFPSQTTRTHDIEEVREFLEKVAAKIHEDEIKLSKNDREVD
ncbi:MAG: molybdenum cofactor carrier protein [Alphaproteobacteria bacterium]|nr:molybdenum cofactor carrier protein [Alphaproteobacteria bacterium]